jgi:PAS domain S-box-containing protein
MTASHFDHLPIPAFALDGEGKIVSWNHAMAALSGVEASGLLGQGVRALPLGGEQRTARALPPARLTFSPRSRRLATLISNIDGKS